MYIVVIFKGYANWFLNLTSVSLNNVAITPKSWTNFAGVFWWGSYNIFKNCAGGLFFWGVTNTSRESTMYPKAVQDLCGWKVRSLACGKSSIVIAADDSTISWGPSPTFGELVSFNWCIYKADFSHPKCCTIIEMYLRAQMTAELAHLFWLLYLLWHGFCVLLQGYGDNKAKSSTTAQEVKTLDGVYTEQVWSSN